MKKERIIRTIVIIIATVCGIIAFLGIENKDIIKQGWFIFCFMIAFYLALEKEE